MPSSLKPWYAVATPHEDIREGRLSEAVFAANLWAVVQASSAATALDSNVAEVYLDPEAFFAKTYLTTGLTAVTLQNAGFVPSDKGNVALDNWSEIFRCFVSPVARMNPKQLRLGIDIEMVTQDDQPLDENNPTLKAMKESARQLRLEIEEE